MKIKAITKYIFKGEEFNSLQEIQNKIHDIIGVEVLDKIQRVCPPEKQGVGADNRHTFVPNCSIRG